MQHLADRRPKHARPASARAETRQPGDYARLHGWPQSYVSRLAKPGIVVLRLNGGRVWVDVDASDQRYGDEIRPRLRFGKDN